MNTLSRFRNVIGKAFLVALLAGCAGAAGAQAAEDQPEDSAGQGTAKGVLILAHGGKPAWNEAVLDLARDVDKTLPAEVAFGMAHRHNLQRGVDKLVERGAQEIVAVPLFVSSHSSVITATQYLLGVRDEAPPQLARYAKMAHGHGGDSSHEGDAPAADPTSPVDSPAPIRMTSALDGHPIVAGILLSRAKALSESPEKEAVILVAHGPVSDEDNAKWLADMGVLAEHMRSASPFKRIEYLTVRDDAPKPVRDQAAAELRALVKSVSAEDCEPLIVPLLISYGGIEKGIRKRLEGLSYEMSPQALLPDDRLADWVLASARESSKASQDAAGQRPAPRASR